MKKFAIRFARRVGRRGGGLFLTLALCLALLAFASCNVTRTVTTSSQYYQRGDTSVVIQTKTVESYDGSVKPKP